MQRSKVFAHVVQGLLIVVCATLVSNAAAAPASTIPGYFVVPAYPVPGSALAAELPEIAGFPPPVRVIGGADNPPPTITDRGAFEDVYRIIEVGPEPYPDYGFYLISQYLPFKRGAARCAVSPVYGLAASYVPGQVTQYLAAYTDCTQTPTSEPQNLWAFLDRSTIKTPIRRKAIDGSEYDAVPVAFEREGLPWITYFMGYRMGVTASESNWQPGSETRSTTFLSTFRAPATAPTLWSSFPQAADNFELAKLPPPFVEGEVIEYVYRPLPPNGFWPSRNYFFYSASASEQSALEASGIWYRTGYTFKHGGYVSVCRFFGGTTTRKAHVFSADGSECASLRATPDYADEGLPFRANVLIPASANNPIVTCPVESKPLYRVLDPRGENSRYTTSRLLVDGMTRGGVWQDKGAVMCVPN